MMNIRVYADTSVFGGIYDDNFKEESEEFFEEVKKNRFTLITSAVVQAEIEPAPEKVSTFFDNLLGIAEYSRYLKRGPRTTRCLFKSGDCNT